VRSITVVHFWNNFIIINGCFKILLSGVEEQLFGHYIVNKGVLSYYAQLIPVLLISALYISFLMAKKERAFLLDNMYKFHLIFLIICIVAYIFDLYLYWNDKENFCKLQLAGRLSDCEKRNRFFVYQALFFYFVWAPVWFGCAGAHKRLADVLRAKERRVIKDDFNIDRRTKSKRKLFGSTIA